MWLMSRMNWSRVRGEKLVHERGFEPVWGDSDRDVSVGRDEKRPEPKPKHAHAHTYGPWKAPLKLIDDRRYRHCSTCGHKEYEGSVAQKGVGGGPTRSTKKKKAPKTSQRGVAPSTSSRASAGQASGNEAPAGLGQPRRLITSTGHRNAPRRVATEPSAAALSINWAIHTIKFDRRKGRYFCTCPWPGTRTAHSEDEARAQHQHAWNQLSPKSRSKWQMRAKEATRAIQRPR